MRHGHWMACAAIAIVLAAPLLGQGVPPNRTQTQPKATRDRPHLMVANPYASAGTDSAAAVQIGSGLRDKMKEIAGDDYQVIEQRTMNEALQQYRYPADAMLTPTVAVTLAKQVQARTVITGTLTKADDRYTVVARLAGVSDEAGNAVTLTQQPAEALNQFGARIAVALEPAVKALGDAKTCVDLQETQTDKAMKAAEKALRKVPNHGLARTCLAQIALKSKPPRTAEAKQQLEAAVQGDPLSIFAWSALAQLYQQANDTAKAVEAYRQLLRVTPNDDRIREQIFRYFLQVGQPKMALDVANEGLKMNPPNPELYNLKANACLFMTPSDYRCAVEALEAMYAADSTLTDTLFFAKISGAALQSGDTTRFIKWTQIGARTYPTNLTLLSNLNRAYAASGQVDSSVAVTGRLIARDTTAVVPALTAVQLLAQADRLQEAAPFVDFVTKRGTKDDRQKVGGLLITAASKKLQPDTAAGQKRDLVAAAAIARQGLALVDTTAKAWTIGNYVVGLATFFQVSEMDDATAKQKSCDGAKQEQSLLQEAEPALTNAKSVNPKSVAQYLDYVGQYNKRVNAMIKSYCK